LACGCKKFHRAGSMTIAGELAKYELDSVGVQEAKDGTGVGLNQQAIVNVPVHMEFPMVIGSKPNKWG
jgi:hypothetical protein